MVATLFQHCYALLPSKSSLRIVSCNITLIVQNNGKEMYQKSVLHVRVDERAIIVQLRWVWKASEQEAGAHFTCRLADNNLERIRRLFSNL